MYDVEESISLQCNFEPLCPNFFFPPSFLPSFSPSPSLLYRLQTTAYALALTSYNHLSQLQTHVREKHWVKSTLQLRQTSNGFTHLWSTRWLG